MPFPRICSAPVIRFRNYQPRDAGLVGGEGAKKGSAAGGGAGAAAAPARPEAAPVATLVPPPPAPSVLLAQKEAVEQSQLLANAKNVSSVKEGALAGRPSSSSWPVCPVSVAIPNLNATRAALPLTLPPPLPRRHRWTR
jgi:hypothetical protein